MEEWKAGSVQRQRTAGRVYASMKLEYEACIEHLRSIIFNTLLATT